MSGNRSPAAARLPLLACAPVLLSGALLSGCVVKAAYDVATVPVHAVGKAVDWTTTSPSEADRNRGRALRKHDEKLGALQRSYQHDAGRCDRGDQRACEAARADSAKIAELDAKAHA
jgi:hypothetical protein